jgi:hypothetical protein
VVRCSLARGSKERERERDHDLKISKEFKDLMLEFL